MNGNEDLTVTRDEAVALLKKEWTVNRETKWISLREAAGRVTAKPVFSVNSMPVCRTSQFDGIAVKSENFIDGVPDTSGWVKGADYAQADTGDDFPDEFDTIIAVEDIYYDKGGKLCFSDDFVFEKGDGIRKAGTAVEENDLLVDAHTRLTAVHLPVLALGGIYQLEVIKKPKVVYIPTGSELINVGIKPERGQNIEANGLMVSEFLKQWGAEPSCYPIIKDKPAELEQALDSALNVADIVLINGGSSKGAEDFNATLLQRKAAVYRHGIKAIPGKPVAIAIIGGKPVVNLPGPTLATFLALDWCVSGLVHHYLGLNMPVRPKMKATLEKALEKRPDYEMFYRFVLTEKNGRYYAGPIGRDKSVPYALLKADAMLIAPIGASGYAAGEEIEVELLCGLENLQ
ncbi:molybdopterin molybdotransferase [Sporobacter termitidis DSM 10068]|uniref:Molybdopterin molybdenumtransferase n=1 Tax=Sporobacter termitidis DSM 10068 TaxID=1123282 RepID=A0A1M5XCE7_9FIRM|nr:molybdopterin molybdotransferase MoeA [Sporobacter termitidis]SHH97525.1 molybdopterin molybdotransferase [Sporobacter termitidis DSM 10068]